MTEKSKKNLKKPEKAQSFVWKPIEGFNLEPGFLPNTLFRPKKTYVQKKNKIG
jgi:hypothetical protein